MKAKVIKKYSELNINQKINAKVDIFFELKSKNAKLMWAACGNWLIIL